MEATSMECKISGVSMSQECHMKKVILNKCYGLFRVSPKGYSLYAEKIGKNLYYYRGNHDAENTLTYTKENLSEFIKNEPALLYFYSFVDHGEKIIHSSFDDKREGCLVLDEKHRLDPVLIEVIEELGDEASSHFSNLQIVEIPNDVIEDYMIDDYDGFEMLHKRVVEY